MKVIAILFMVIFHIFAFPSRIKNVEYISLGIVNGVPIEQLISSFGGICVEMFLFLSGYGLYIVYQNKITYKQIGRRLFKLYKNYWVVMLVFIPIGIFMGVYRFDVKELILSIAALTSSYNHEWWFLNLYIILILLYPLTIRLFEKFNFRACLFGILMVNLIGMIVVKLGIILDIKFSVIKIISNVLTLQLIFNAGVLVAKYAFFDKIREKIGMNKITYLLAAITIMVIDMFNIINIPIIDEYIRTILALIFIYVLVNLVSEKSILRRCAKHTTNIWLVHSFFCYYIFQKVAFAPKYSILIIGWILLLSFISSVIINFILNTVEYTLVRVGLKDSFI